ncbi:MAG: hypothetical protein ACXITV_07420 [Luteibaculaceae bacterium]
MKNAILFVSVAFVSTLMVSCGSNNSASQNVEVVDSTAVALDATVLTIDEYRKSVENAQIEPVELTTESMSAEVKEKWSKIHFYADNGDLVKIKTYPHEGSEKTEEFYFQDGKLVTAVIESNGAGTKGKDKSALDQVLYFSEGSLIANFIFGEASSIEEGKEKADKILGEAAEYKEAITSI